MRATTLTMQTRTLATDALSLPPVSPGFYVLRDDLLHPLLGGNKMRKLDAILPLMHTRGVTQVVRLRHLAGPEGGRCRHRRGDDVTVGGGMTSSLAGG